MTVVLLVLSSLPVLKLLPISEPLPVSFKYCLHFQTTCAQIMCYRAIACWLQHLSIDVGVLLQASKHCLLLLICTSPRLFRCNISQPSSTSLTQQYAHLKTTHIVIHTTSTKSYQGREYHRAPSAPSHEQRAEHESHIMSCQEKRPNHASLARKDCAIHTSLNAVKWFAPQCDDCPVVTVQV